MDPVPELEREEEVAGLNVHIFSVSAAMVGVCLTVVGIIRIVISNNPSYATLADDILAVDSVVFVASCLLAYASLRAASTRHTHRFQRLADAVFFVGLVLMMIACLLVASSLL